MPANVALIQEALEYQEATSELGPLFPEAQDELRRLLEQYEDAQRKLSCGYKTGTGTNCGECRDCLKVNWYFGQEAVGNLKEQFEAWEAYLRANPDVRQRFESFCIGRCIALEGSNPAKRRP